METKYPSRYFSIDGHDSGRRESVDGREDRRLHQPRVGQRHEVVVAVDEVELGGVLEHFGDVKVLGDFGIDRADPLHTRGPPRRAGERASRNPRWRTASHPSRGRPVLR